MNGKIPTCILTIAALAFIGAPAAAQSLRGSPASVERMYRIARQNDLEFFASGGAIRDSYANGNLIRLRGDDNFSLSNVSYPYVLPPTFTFVKRLASQYRAACGEEMVVTSATRPESMHLANSVDESVHPTGMAVDLRKPRNARCLNWLRSTLLSLDAAGLLEAIEEHYPAHFHVAVFPKVYTAYVERKTGGSGMLASASDSERKYEVRRGDSLWTIARRNDLTVDRLKAANGLSGSRILAGQILLIPSR